VCVCVCVCVCKYCRNVGLVFVVAIYSNVTDRLEYINDFLFEK